MTVPRQDERTLTLCEIQHLVDAYNALGPDEWHQSHSVRLKTYGDWWEFHNLMNFDNELNDGELQ